MLSAGADTPAFLWEMKTNLFFIKEEVKAVTTTTLMGLEVSISETAVPVINYVPFRCTPVRQRKNYTRAPCL